jgi:ATP-dependent Clp protease ATP-binding subunit ClpA
MFELFTDRARRAMVLAQQEARMLNHDYVGTEHILLGLMQEREGFAARALESLGISLDAGRQQVEEVTGQGQQAPSGHISFTPRAKKVLELSLREAQQLDAQKVEQAASLGEQEKEVLASKAARQQQRWVARHPELSVLAERCQQLADQIERLRAALRQHGIDPQDKPA